MKRAFEDYSKRNQRRLKKKFMGQEMIKRAEKITEESKKVSRSKILKKSISLNLCLSFFKLKIFVGNFYKIF